VLSVVQDSPPATRTSKHPMTTNDSSSTRRSSPKQSKARPKSVFISSGSEPWIDLSKLSRFPQTLEFSSALSPVSGSSTTKISPRAATNTQPTSRVGVPIWSAPSSSISYGTTTLPSPPSEHKHTSRHASDETATHEEQRRRRRSLEQRAYAYGMTLAEYFYDGDSYEIARQKIAARHRAEKERLQTLITETLARHQAELTQHQPQ